MSCTMFPLCCLTSISFQDLVWIWFQCIAWDWHDQAAMSRQTVGHQGVPKSTSIYPPGTHWLAPGPRYCLPSTRAHSTNNCAPAPPSKEPGARPVFQYLVSCQTQLTSSCQPGFPTWVPTSLSSNCCVWNCLFSPRPSVSGPRGTKTSGTPVPLMCSAGNTDITQHNNNNNKCLCSTNRAICVFHNRAITRNGLIPLWLERWICASTQMISRPPRTIGDTIC